LDGRIADEDIDPPELSARLIDEVLQRFLGRDVGRHHDRGARAMLAVDRLSRLIARIRLAAGDDDFGALIRHRFRYRSPDPA
jgi:hypothetical protein